MTEINRDSSLLMMTRAGHGFRISRFRFTGSKTPQFLEYIYRHLLPVLLPILILAGSIVFFVWK